MDKLHRNSVLFIPAVATFVALRVPCGDQADGLVYQIIRPSGQVAHVFQSIDS